MCVRRLLSGTLRVARKKIVDAYRSSHGVTPEMLEALSWLGRGALVAKQWDTAEGCAKQTYDLALSALKGRSVDQALHLPIALGAAIDVLGHVRAQRGARSEAVHILNQELTRYTDTSLAKRIQKTFISSAWKGSARRRSRFPTTSDRRSRPPWKR